MADTKKIIISVEVKEVGAKQVSQATSKAVKDLTKLTKAEKDNMVAAELLRQKNILVKNEIAGLANQALNASKNLGAMKATSGLNNAILLETSRLASDASYGFQGISNNLGQLISLLQISAQNAGGFKETLKELGKSLLGTGGLLIGVQLLISFLPKIERFFTKTSQEAKKAKEEIDSLTKSINNHITAIETLSSSTLNYNVQGLALQENVDILSTKFSEFATGIKKLTKEQNLNNKTQSSLINSFLRLNNVRKEILVLENEAQKAAEKGIAANNIKKKGERTLAGIIREKYLELIKLEKLFTLEEDKGSKKRKGRVTRFTEFKQKLFNLDKDIERIEQDSLNRFLQTEQAKLTQEEANQKNIYRVRFKVYKDTQALRQQEFTEQQETRLKTFLNRKKDSEKTKQELQEDLIARKNFNEAILKSKKELNDSIKDGERELDDVLKAIEDNFKDRRIILNDEIAKKVLETYYKTELAQAKAADAQSGLLKIFQDKAEEVNIRQLTFQVNLQEKLVKIYKDGTIEKANAELELAKLQEKLGNAEMSRQQRRFNELKEIYKQATGVITGISDTRKNIEINNAREEYEARVAAGHDEVEAKKQFDKKIEEADKKAWKIEQGLKISKVIMDTIQAGWLSYGSQLIIGDPSSPVRAQIAQALTLASGAAQIAAIASTRYNSKNLSGGGAGGSSSSTNVEAPDFNVVGASPESQLAASISGQQTKPLRAFVVAKDMTNQQELDRNIATTAGL